MALRPVFLSASPRLFLGVISGLLIASPAFAEDGKKKPLHHAPPVVAAPVGEALKPPTSDVRPGLAGSFLSGKFAKQNQDIKEAAKYLDETLARDPANPQLAAETMRMQLLAGNAARATQLAHQLTSGTPGDPLIASILMLEQVKAGNYAEARHQVEQASNAGLFGLIRPVMVEWLRVGAGEKKRAIDLRGAIEKAGFLAPFINYHAALMQDVLGNTDAARAAYAKASADPAVTPYRVVEALANFDARSGKWDEAQAAFDAYAKANPQSTFIPDRLSPGPAPAPLVADARAGLAELYFTTASVLFGEEASQETFLYLRIALELRPDLPPAQLMLANLYEQLGDYKQAIAMYDGIAEGTVFARRAQVRKALNYEALGQKEKAISLLDSLAAKHPSDAAPLITKGDMLRDTKDYAKAAEAYSAAITRTEPLATADWPLLYARGISYERNNQWDLAEADFNRALTLEPNQPDVLNYLAYSWLTMGKNIAKAREYLEIASAARPDDAHIIDSVGWAEFLNGEYAAAVGHFEHAVELMPSDPTVNDHLGDAYWRVGREDEARYQWQRALTFKPEKDIADELNKKISSGLPPTGKPAPASKEVRGERAGARG